jgi:hypothetical protein
LVGNGTKPLDVSLELTELNCNWNNDDNTSWGGRSYYDVDLFASSATFNEDDSQAVYVGTTETPIKATIESKDYFANLQISAIRYDVAFDEENRPLNVRGFYELNGKIGNKTSDLIYDSGMLLDCIKQLGEEFEHTYEPTDNLKITCSTTVNSIKTFTDVIIYLKPYSDDETNDLFYLLNPGSTSPEFKHIFWDEPTTGVAEPIFETSYYTCLRLRFKDEEGGKLVLSHLNDNGNLPCDLNNLSVIVDKDKITGTTNTVRTISVGINEENKYILTCEPNEPNNLVVNSYIITDGYNIIYDGFSSFSVSDNTTFITKITQDIKTTNSTITINYLNKDNKIKQATRGVIARPLDSFDNIELFNGEFNNQQAIFVSNLPEDYNEDYYGEDRTIYGIKNPEESSIKTFYFFGTHLDANKYEISTTSDDVTLGLNNKYYHILNSKTSGNILTKNTQSSSGLGITEDREENVYSIKFNNFKWNIGKFNASFERYNSGIGCGKLLPFPKREQNNVQKGIQHLVLDNSPWYLTLSKNVSTNVTLFDNIYTDFVFDKSNNVILSNNYIERLLPNGVNCYYLGDLYLNNEPILINSITEFEIQEFSKDNESNSNSNTSSPGTQEPPSEVLPELPENPGVVNPS